MNNIYKILNGMRCVMRTTPSSSKVAWKEKYKFYVGEKKSFAMLVKHVYKNIHIFCQNLNRLK